MSIVVLRYPLIAVDGRLVDDGTIVSDSYLKMRENKGVIFFIVGEPCHFDEFIDHYFSEEPFPEIKKNAIVRSLVFDGKKIFYSFLDELGLVTREPVHHDMPFAIGSGETYAYGAIDCGKNAIEAVQIAIKRNIHCGGIIRNWKISIDSESGNYKLDQLEDC